ncbi:hypothetical protein PROFUN_09652, partial [Planoprotostelium fungivorum]
KPFKSPVKRTQTIHEILGLQLAQPAQDDQLSIHKKTSISRKFYSGARALTSVLTRNGPPTPV